MQPSGILYLQTQILTQIPLKWTETFHFADLFPAPVKENKIQGKNKIKITSKKMLGKQQNEKRGDYKNKINLFSYKNILFCLAHYPS